MDLPVIHIILNFQCLDMLSRVASTMVKMSRGKTANRILLWLISLCLLQSSYDAFGLPLSLPAVRCSSKVIATLPLEQCFLICKYVYFSLTIPCHISQPLPT